MPLVNPQALVSRVAEAIQTDAIQLAFPAENPDTQAALAALALTFRRGPLLESHHRLLLIALATPDIDNLHYRLECARLALHVSTF